MQAKVYTASLVFVGQYMYRNNCFLVGFKVALHAQCEFSGKCEELPRDRTHAQWYIADEIPE